MNIVFKRGQSEVFRVIHIDESLDVANCEHTVRQGKEETYCGVIPLSLVDLESIRDSGKTGIASIRGATGGTVGGLTCEKQ